MKVSSVLLWSMLTASALRGATILDVTGDTRVTLQTGDTLGFEILTGSFGKNAAAFGLPQTPTTVSFALISAPLDAAGSFSVWLGSLDGEISADLKAPVTFRDGAFSSSGYRGRVSSLDGVFSLPPSSSKQIFDGGSAILNVRNDGPAITIQFAPYTLKQDLFVSLGGGPLSVGGLVQSVMLSSAGESGFEARNSESFDSPLGPISAATNLEAASPVPEPGSSALFFAGGGALCAVSILLNRFSRRRR